MGRKNLRTLGVVVVPKSFDHTNQSGLVTWPQHPIKTGGIFNHAVWKIFLGTGKFSWEITLSEMFFIYWKISTALHFSKFLSSSGSSLTLNVKRQERTLSWLEVGLGLVLLIFKSPSSLVSHNSLHCFWWCLTSTYIYLRKTWRDSGMHRLTLLIWRQYV